jgi:signal transduction histidine kinase
MLEPTADTDPATADQRGSVAARSDASSGARPGLQRASDRHHAEAVRRLYQSLDGEVRWVVLLPVLLVGGLWPYVPHLHLLAWLAPALIVPAWRYWLVRRFLDTEPEPAHTRRWAYHMAATTAADGLVWGTAGFAFLVPDALLPQLLVLAMLVGIPAGSIFINSWWPPSLLAYAIPSLGLTAFGLVRLATPVHLAIAGGLIVYLAIIHQILRQAHTSATETIALRFENVELIERLREEKAAAEDANLAKSKFLAAASHDLRQPLHALGLFVAALSERMRMRRAETESLLDNIERCIAALETLLDALLDISKLDAGVITPQIRSVPLAPLIAQISAEYAPQAHAKGLAWREPHTTAVVLSDGVLLERILRNLVSNAIRYTSHGEVELACATRGGDICLEVRDTGIGIAPQHHRDVFREFFQLHNSERDRTKGLGLGLAIVRRLTRLLGHRLEMHSEPGAGTTFRLLLPPGDPAAARAATAPEPSLIALDERQGLVLLIDDEPDIRSAMRTLLENWGYAVVAVANGEDAVPLLDRAPDALIADYRLSAGQTGDRTIRALQQRFGKSIPALIVTGETSVEVVRRLNADGFVVLHKPVAPAKLRAFLRSTAVR